MAGYVNKAMIIGNLGRDPEMRYTQGGQAVTNFSVATNRRWVGRDGEPGEATEWHNIVAWGKLAEICNEYLSKGSSVYIRGSSPDTPVRGPRGYHEAHDGNRRSGDADARPPHAVRWRWWMVAVAVAAMTSAASRLT